MTAPMIEHHFRVALHDTDAAGVLFFAHLFRHAHDAYEAMMARIGWPVDGLIRGRQIGLPLVHVEADFRRPMRHGDQVDVVIELKELGERRFSLAYGFFIGDQEVATALSVHVAIDPRTGKSQALPTSLISALSARSG
ncbi:MAG: acyl-CoA thioesterase [Chromatiaceae bacterium]|nr:acyl-CoA thioesterase [Chromatiaceae bacterium]MCF8016953.1 acyl-CoA thioesterase [Chromatiaceae bacterium]